MKASRLYDAKYLPYMKSAMNISPAKHPRRFGRIFKGCAVLTIAGVIGIAALLGSLWLERRTEVTLPAPTGPFAVGRSLYDWTDDTTLDTLAPVAGTRRELLVWIWYPCVAGQQTAMDEYSPAPMRAAAGAPGSSSVFTLLTRDPSKVHSHSHRDSAVSPLQRSYPVVIMRAGASAEVVNYSTLAEDLASHGYVVVGLDAPYRTGRVVFPDGRVMRRTPENNPELVTGRQFELRAAKLLAAWTGDMAFALDRLAQLNASDTSGRFTGRLDMSRVGAFGHSFGGAQAAQFCHDDSRCKAGIDIDGAPLGSVIQAGIARPFMFLLSDHSHESGPESSQVMANIQSIYDRLPADGRLLIVIRGANHFTFSDDGAILKSHLVGGVLRLFGMLRIDGPRQLEVTAYCVLTFFDAYLKGAGGSRLTIASPRYPEIQVLSDR